MLESACACSRQRGGAWAHDCAVRDEEVAEDQDESGGHGGWGCVADVASFLNGMSSEVESSSSVCVCLQRGVVWALVVVELVCEVQCVERDGGRTAVHVFCHVTAVCLTFMYSPSHPIIARRCRIGVSPTSISAIAATDHHPEGKIAVVCWRAISSSSL